MSVRGLRGIDVSNDFDLGLGLGFEDRFVLPLQLFGPVVVPLGFVFDVGALALPRFGLEGLTRTNMARQYEGGFDH